MSVNCIFTNNAASLIQNNLIELYVFREIYHFGLVFLDWV